MNCPGANQSLWAVDDAGLVALTCAGAGSGAPPTRVSSRSSGARCCSQTSVPLGATTAVVSEGSGGVQPHVRIGGPGGAQRRRIAQFAE